ncbi:hypothetical protein VTI28DRAFT_3782 [Corynascus sepedonium]
MAPSTTPLQYRVFKLKFKLAMQDPDMPQPRYHHIIFVESNPKDGSGIKFHNSKTLHSSELLGWTDAANFKNKFDQVLKACPPPPQQKAFNTKTMKNELFKTKSPLTFYGPNEKRRPLKKCTEWTEEQAIPALRVAGLIGTKKASPSPPGSRPGSRGKN